MKTKRNEERSKKELLRMRCAASHFIVIPSMDFFLHFSFLFFSFLFSVVLHWQRCVRQNDYATTHTAVPTLRVSVYVHSGIGSKNRNDNSIQNLLPIKRRTPTPGNGCGTLQMQTKRFSPQTQRTSNALVVRPSDEMLVAVLWIDSCALCVCECMRRRRRLWHFGSHSAKQPVHLVCAVRWTVIVSQITRIHFLVNTA